VLDYKIRELKRDIGPRENDIATLAHLRMGQKKAKAFTSGQMVPDTLETGSLMRCPAKAFFNGQMAATTKGSLSQG